MTIFRKTIILFSLFSALAFLYPHGALAFENTITCESGTPGDGRYTQLVIDCIKIPVKNAVLGTSNSSIIGLLPLMSIFMITVTSSLMVLAVMFFGIRLLAGEPNVKHDAFTTILRLGFVLAFSSQLGGLGESVFNIFDQLLSLVTPAGFSPWVQIDDFIGKLLGFAPGTEIQDGILGMLNGSFFAKNFGLMLSLVGIFTIISLLLFIFQATYLYLSSIIVIGFLLTISPIIIPFALFNYTKRIPEKWLSMLISSMLTPMIMFALLTMFLGIPGRPAPEDGVFKEYIDQIFQTLGPEYLSRCIHAKQPLTKAWLLPTDADKWNTIACKNNTAACTEISKNYSPTQLFMYQNANKSLNYSPFNVQIFDCGVNDPAIKQTVMKYLFLILFTTVIMNSILKVIPRVSSDISRGAATGVENLMSPVATIVNRMRSR
jgi:hypothetical protein